MAVVQRFGKADIFLTMTCNHNWSKIKKKNYVMRKHLKIDQAFLRGSFMQN